MNALCFDNDTKPFCRNPFCLISIQNPRGRTPSLLCCLVSMNYKTAPAPPNPNRPEPEEFGAPPPTPWSYGRGLYLQPTQTIVPPAARRVPALLRHRSTKRIIPTRKINRPRLQYPTDAPTHIPRCRRHRHRLKIFSRRQTANDCWSIAACSRAARSCASATGRLCRRTPRRSIGWSSRMRTSTTPAMCRA